MDIFLFYVRIPCIFLSNLTRAETLWTHRSFCSIFFRWYFRIFVDIVIDFWHLYSVRGTYITCLRLCDACVPDAAIAPIACICLYFCRFTVTVIAHCRQSSRTTVAEKQKKTPVKISQMPRDENTSAHFCGLFFNEKHVTNFGTWRNPETEIVPRNNRICGAGAAGRSIYIRRSHPLSPAHVFLSECFIACQLLLLQQYMGHVVFGRAIALCYVISPAAFSAADNKNAPAK